MTVTSRPQCCGMNLHISLDEQQLKCKGTPYLDILRDFMRTNFTFHAYIERHLVTEARMRNAEAYFPELMKELGAPAPEVLATLKDAKGQSVRPVLMKRIWIKMAQEWKTMKEDVEESIREAKEKAVRETEAVRTVAQTSIMPKLKVKGPAISLPECNNEEKVQDESRTEAGTNIGQHAEPIPQRSIRMTRSSARALETSLEDRQRDTITEQHATLKALSSSVTADALERCRWLKLLEQKDAEIERLKRDVASMHDMVRFINHHNAWARYEAFVGGFQDTGIS